MKLCILLILLLATLASAQQIPHCVILSCKWSGTGTTSISVYRSTASGGEAKPALTTGLASCAFTDSTAVVGTQYFYTMTATVGGVESAPSTEVSAQITVPPSPTSPATTVY